MTGQSFYKKYLLYRISAQKTNLVLCCILSFLTLPLFVMAQAAGFKDEFSQFYSFGKYFSMICGVSLMVVAIMGALSAFEFYNRKNLTDTVGSLPLSYKQRFWGDLLSGFIANVLPVIPMGIIAGVIAAADSNFNRLFELFTNAGVNAFGFILLITLSLTVAMTFVYLLTVLVTSACGKTRHSVLFSVFGIAALDGLVISFTGWFAACMLGVPVSTYTDTAKKLIPPLGPLTEALDGANFPGYYIQQLKGSDGGIELNTGLASDFSITKPLFLLFFVILGAAIIIGAYFIGKRRRPEKTGSAFAVRPVFYAISALMTAAAVFIVLSLYTEGHAELGRMLLEAAIAGAVVCAVSVIIYFPKSKKLPECILCGMLSVGAAVGLAELVKQTDSFGAAYLPENADNIEYVRVNYEYEITDKDDIAQYLKRHNEILRSNRDILEYASNYVLEVKTTSGKTIERGYWGWRVYNASSPLQQMIENEQSLPGYGRYFFEGNASYGDFKDWIWHIVEGDREYDIPEKYRAEFIKTVREEAEEKYDPNARVYARMGLAFDSWHVRSFHIGENLDQTVALLKRIKNDIGPDPNGLVVRIEYSDSKERKLNINIRNKDMDDPLVRELIELLNEDGSVDRDFTVTYDSSSAYYSGSVEAVPKKNSKRVLEIMTKLAIDELAGQ